LSTIISTIEHSLLIDELQYSDLC